MQGINFVRAVAWRYLRAKRAESFIAIITWFSLIGIALGVATLIIVMSVMNGFRAELIGRILGLNGHVNIYDRGGLMTDYDFKATQAQGAKGVLNVLPTIEGQGLLNVRGQASGVVVRAFTPQDLPKKELLLKGLPRAQRQNFADDKVLIGEAMAQRLQLRVGDVLVLLSPKGKTTPLGTMPRSMAFEVGGIFDVGMFEYNNNFVFMTLGAAQKFFQYDNAVTHLEVITSDPQHLGQIKGDLAVHLGEDVIITDWQQSNNSFYQALQVERNVMFIILTLIILVAAFNIISSLIMLVKDKVKDIAIMRTFGASRRMVLQIFFLTGASIGVLGTLFGAFFGLLITLNLPHVQKGLEAVFRTKLFPPEIYFLSRLPAVIDWQEITLVITMALVLSFLATLYPAWRAAKIHPVEALRHG